MITLKLQVMRSRLYIFETLEDPRGKQGREHDFLNIVMIAILEFGFVNLRK
jgi:hypothetical protein